MMRAHATARAPEPDAVLTKATLRAAEALDLTDGQLARIIGVSGPSVSRLRSSTRRIDPGLIGWPFTSPQQSTSTR